MTGKSWVDLGLAILYVVMMGCLFRWLLKPDDIKVGGSVILAILSHQLYGIDTRLREIQERIPSR